MEGTSNYTEPKPIYTLGELIEYSELPVKDFNLLPLCHTTTKKGMIKMLMSNQLRGQDPDPHSGKLLVNFFYGRARYIPQADFKDTYKRSNPPVALLYEIDDMPHPHCMFPFDSGGYHRLNFDADIKDFRIFLGIEEKGKGIKSYIQELYSCNQNYLSKTLTINAVNYPLCTPLELLAGLYDVLHHPLRRDEDLDLDFGEQAYTAEIQYEGSVPLNPVAVILPKYMVSTPEAISQILAAFNFTPDDAMKRIFPYDLPMDKGVTDIYKEDIIKKVNEKVNDYLNPPPAKT